MSWKPEVQTGSDPQWYQNGLAFATVEEAQAYARDLTCRWTAVRDYRVVQSDEPTNYRWTEAGLERMP